MENQSRTAENGRRSQQVEKVGGLRVVSALLRSLDSEILLSFRALLNQSPNPCMMNSKEQNFKASSSSTIPCGGDNEGGDEQQRENNYEVFLSCR
ncbi:hypothetical protein NL676_010880 [Syzygium grande]|nr:hypothetical protein NL676_010880 [Syzygium grande]